MSGPYVLLDTQDADRHPSTYRAYRQGLYLAAATTTLVVLGYAVRVQPFWLDKANPSTRLASAPAPPAQVDPEVQAILARASKRKHLKQREEKKWNSELHILDRALEVQHHEIEHREQKATAGRLGADKSTNRSSLQHAESPATNQSLQLFAQVNVYLGNGNFFARQGAYVAAERQMPFSRSVDHITSLAGYAGSKQVGKGGLVCYYGAQPYTIYESLGYAQVVQVTVNPRERPQEHNQHQAAQEFEALMNDYFASFHGGQHATADQGAQFRNCIGLPGGTNSVFYRIVEKANVNNMNLVRGQGNDQDAPNTVYIYDSGLFPFHRAEQYLQFKQSPADLKSLQIKAGRIPPTGCTEQ
eukprot:Tamp_19129.p1 GENE.Tamp_19129~~Tamp_19129.p1  ORF type:complete len:373 (+),score=63.46 Tamp_19129:49-1119(+)